jgi:hypothetical protein
MPMMRQPTSISYRMPICRLLPSIASKTIYVRLFDAVTTACANIRPFTIYPATTPTELSLILLRFAATRHFQWPSQKKPIDARRSVYGDTGG